MRTCADVLTSKNCKAPTCDERCEKCESEGKCNLCPYHGCSEYPLTKEEAK